jgi:lipoprotein-anchoring transpeptidase ErfK/SrfK
MKRIFGIGLVGLTALFGGCAQFETAMYDLRPRPAGRSTVLIDLSDQHAYLMRGGRVVLTSQVSTGREGYNTPSGKYSIIEKDIDHRSSLYGAYVRDGYVVKRDVDVRKDPRPRGAKFVGAPMPYFLRIHGGVGLHAGYLPGYPASHGCIRMPPSRARRFYEAVALGTPVTVRR